MLSKFVLFGLSEMFLSRVNPKSNEWMSELITCLGAEENNQ